MTSMSLIREKQRFNVESLAVLIDILSSRETLSDSVGNFGWNTLSATERPTIMAMSVAQAKWMVMRYFKQHRDPNNSDPQIIRASFTVLLVKKVTIS